MFKDFTGTSLSDYIRNERIELSCRLLATSKMAINDIITRCGFANRSSFFTIFKRLKHMTPREYQLQHQVPENDME